MEDIRILKEKLSIKQKELDDYVLDTNNDCLSEEAEEMRAEIYNLQNEISKKESNYNLVEEDIKKIEEIINWLKDSSYPYDISLTRDDIQSLENLIKGYRELEQQNELYRLTIGEPPLYEGEIITKSKIAEIRDKAEVMDYYTLNDVIEDLNKLLGDEDK